MTNSPGDDDSVVIGTLIPDDQGGETAEPDPDTADGAQQLAAAQSGQSLNEASATSPPVVISLPGIPFAPVAMPSFVVSLPDISMDPTDLGTSLNSLSSVTPNSLGNMAVSALGDSDVSGLIGALTCGKGISSIPGLAGPLSQMSSFIHQQIGPVTQLMNSLPPQVKNAVHVQMMGSGAGGVMAKDYVANGRNGQLSNAVTNGLGVNDLDLNDAMNGVDRFVAVDAPFLGQDPVLEKTLNQTKQLLSAGEATASAALAIFAPNPVSTQTGAMGSGMSLAEIIKFATQLAQLRCDINNLATQWNGFTADSSELVSSASQLIPEH